jgi:hypothetical protein
MMKYNNLGYMYEFIWLIFHDSFVAIIKVQSGACHLVCK